MRLRRRVFVTILLLGRLDLLREVVLLLRKLLILFQLLYVCNVAWNERRRWDMQALLYGWPGLNALRPCLEAREVVEVDACKPEHVDPAEARDVSDAELIADKVVGVLQVRVEDADKTLRLAGVALHAVWDALLCKAVEVVGLTLHGTEATVLPCHPLFCAGDVERVAEAELMVGVVVAREVCEDRETFLDSEAALVMVDDDGSVVPQSARVKTVQPQLYVHAAIGSQLGEPLLFLNVLADVDTLISVVLAICLLQLLQYD
jgi:hypothetical protein